MYEMLFEVYWKWDADTCYFPSRDSQKWWERKDQDPVLRYCDKHVTQGMYIRKGRRSDFKVP